MTVSPSGLTARQAILCLMALICAPVSAEVVKELSRQFIDLDRERFDYRVALEAFEFGHDGKPGAQLQVISYTALDAGPRPLSFIFNGGPGSSSIWLHMGLLAPRRVNVGADTLDDGAAPFEVGDNQRSLLAVSDLVFVDPVGTGFSHTLGETKPETYWGVDADAKLTADFIRRYLSTHQRWNSPKFLIGESYGTMRIAYSLERLQDDYQGTAINGVVLISPALLKSTYVFSEGNDLPFALFLPTYAAVAHFHGLLDPELGDLNAVISQARRFAVDDYLPALFAGHAIDPGRKARIASGLSRLTGLSIEYLDAANLRITSSRFMKELLRGRRLGIGRLDGRYTVTELDSAGEFIENDPARNAVDSAFLAALWDDLLNPLGVSAGRDYRLLNFQANRSWARPEGSGSIFHGQPNATPQLRAATANNRDLRILVISGLHDLTTTFFGAEYMMAHSGVDPDRLNIRAYPGGHMMYLHPESFVQMSADLIQFFDET